MSGLHVKAVGAIELIAFYSRKEKRMTADNGTILKLFKGIYIKTLLPINDSNNNDSNFNIKENLLKHGIVFDPRIYRVFSTDTLKFLADKAIELYGANAEKLNSTFYKRFSDVATMSEYELRLDQLIHYLSTYGRGIVGQDGTSGSYEPEYLKDVNFDVRHELVYIEAMNKDRLHEKVKNMLISGMALKEETIRDLADVIETFHVDVDFIDKIKNREFMCILCDKLGLLPENFDEFTRFLNYLATDNTMFVLKSRDANAELREKMSSALGYQARLHVNSALQQYNLEYGAKHIATGIRRYSVFYKIIHDTCSNKETKAIINRAFKLAKKRKNRVQRFKPALDRVLDLHLKQSQIENAIDNATVYKLFKVLNYLNAWESTGSRLYRIRNGKTWLTMPKVTSLKEAVAKFTDDDMDEYTEKSERVSLVKTLIRNTLINRLGDWSNKLFYIPEGVKLVLPTSEKTFVGSLPYLSSIEFTSENAIAGVAWEKECDLDLHGMCIDGSHIGWNSSYNSSGVTFSGDMTHTNRYHYAAEFFRLDKSIEKPILVQITNYEYGEDAPIDVFVSADRSISTDSSQGVAKQLNEKSIMFKDKMDEDNKTLMVIYPTEIGFKAIFTSFNFSQVRVPCAGHLSETLTDIIVGQEQDAIDLEELVDLLGGNVTHSMEEVNEIVNNDKQYVPVVLNGKRYTNWNTSNIELIDMTPSKLTSSTFTDLLQNAESEQQEA